MTDYREIIRLHSLKFSNVAIANSLCCSRNTVSEVLKLSETHSLESGSSGIYQRVDTVYKHEDDDSRLQCPDDNVGKKKENSIERILHEKFNIQIQKKKEGKTIQSRYFTERI